MIAACLAVGVARAETPAKRAQPINSGYLPSNMNELLMPMSRRYTPGIWMGAFVAQPRAELSTVFDDNVFSSQADKKADVIKKVDTRVTVISDWKRHAVELYAAGGASFYNEYESEDESYANFGAIGLIDIKRGVWIKGSARYHFDNEPRGLGESTLAFDEPVRTQIIEGGLLMHAQLNRLWAEAGGGIKRQDYSSGQIGGVSFDQSFRNGTTYTALGRLGYEVTNKTSVFAEGSVSTRKFADDRLDGDEYRAVAGIRHELTRLVYGEAAAGYLHFASSGGLQDFDSWVYRGQLRWDTTPLISVAIVGSVDIGSPIDIIGVSNTIESTMGVRVDYALRRNATLTAGFGYGQADYVDIDRLDDYLKATLGAEYEFRPSLSLWTNYAYTHAVTELTSSGSYDKNVIMVGLRARY